MFSNPESTLFGHRLEMEPLKNAINNAKSKRSVLDLTFSPVSHEAFFPGDCLFCQYSSMLVKLDTTTGPNAGRERTGGIRG